MLATAPDLRAFFAFAAKPATEVTTADVLAFIADQRRPRGDGRVVRPADGESGLSSRTIKRRLSSVSGLYGYLTMCEEVGANPVPRGLSTHRPGRRGMALIRTPRTLPRIVEPAEVDALMGTVRRWRDRAMVEAMVLGGLRRCEVLVVPIDDPRPGPGRLFVANGKGGHHRLIPISGRFFRSVAA